jgi:hypothetical protein
MANKRICSAVCLWVLIGIFAAAAAGSAQTPEDDRTTIEAVKQEAKDLVEALKEYSAEQREEAVQRSRTALNILDRRIEELETQIAGQWDQMSSAARDKTRDNLKILRKKRNQVAESYGSLKAGSADVWEEMKKGFSSAYEALSDAWIKAVNEFDSN